MTRIIPHRSHDVMPLLADPTDGFTWSTVIALMASLLAQPLPRGERLRGFL